MLFEGRLDCIQLLRGVAALLVILSHVKFWGYGGFGVDIFFCISGFIMVLVTEKDPSDFLVKRVIRVVPIYWVLTLFLFSLASVMPYFFKSAEADWFFLMKSLFFIPFDRNGYIEPLLGPGWTLNYELFFYVVFFISMKINFEYRALCTSVVFLFLVAVGFFVDNEGLIFGFYSNPIVLEFSLGMLSYYILRYFLGFKVSFDFRWLFLFLSIAIILIMFLYRLRENPDLRLIFWGVPSFLLFNMYVYWSIANDVKQNSFLVFAGNISYSLYLTHIFVVLGFSRLVTSLDEFKWFSPFLVFFLLLLCLCVAKVFYFIFEVKLDRYLRVFLLRGKA